MIKEGNCYVVTEAAWHILGSKKGAWKVYRLKIPGEKYSHWFLKYKYWPHPILDLSRRQFKGKLPDYALAIPAAFLTTKPSKRAKVMIEEMTWQNSEKKSSRSLKRSQ